MLVDARLSGELVDIVIRDGVIRAIIPAGSGGADGASADAGGPLERLDLAGRQVLPGLWDEHVHANQWAQHRRRVALDRAASANQAAALVLAAHRADPDADGVLVGSGYRDGLWADRADAAVLDAVVPHRPVVLIAADLHAVWLNTAALRRFGIGEGCAAAGAGVLREDDAFDIVRRLGEVPDAVLDGWVAEAGRAAAQRGVVGVVDLEMTWNADAWSRRRAAGFDTLRVDFGTYPQHLDRAIGLGLRGRQRIDELITVGPAKVITDGSLNTRTAYCVDPYPGEHAHPHGLLTVPTDELLPLLERASAHGFEPAVHAIGDEANRLALDAFEAAGVGGRIEHAQLLRKADLARFAALGVTASVQPEHAMDDRDVAERYWPGRTGRAFPLAALHAAGARLLLGSDAPVAPLDPWVAISAAVARARDGREPWHPEQGIPIEVALGASTRTRVAVGAPADLIAVDADPATADGETLRAMPVHLTLLAGRVTHLAP